MEKAESHRSFNHVSQNFLNRQKSIVQHYLKYAYTLPFHWKYRGFDYSKRNTIAVFAQPRGGSTWFTDLLASIPNTSKIDGPLYQGSFVPDGSMPAGKEAKLKSFHQLGLHYHQWLPDDADEPEIRSFFSALFAQKFYTPYIFQETPLSKLVSAERFVFKFYHASLMMPWLIRHFDITPVFLVRNPYAVIASQLQYEAFVPTLKTGMYELPKMKYAMFFEPYRDILSSISKPEEILAARWCLNYVPLITRLENNQSWHTVSYEGMLMHKDWELNRLFQYVGAAIPAEVDHIYREPSLSTEKSVKDYRDVSRHLDRWKEVLTTEQVGNVERVLSSFGVAGYDQSTEPDYPYIYNGLEP